MAKKQYKCETQACSLGAASQHGYFTSGISEEQAVMLTGDPQAKHGNGYCPNCGKKGKAA